MVGGALSSTARATLVSHTRELCVRPTGIGRTKDPERRQKPVHLPHVSTEQKTRGLTCRHMTICKVEIKAKTFSCFHLYVSKYNAIIFETLALAHTKKKIKKNSQKCSAAGQHRVVGGAESGGGGRSETLSPHLASGPFRPCHKAEELLHERQLLLLPMAELLMRRKTAKT